MPPLSSSSSSSHAQSTQGGGRKACEHGQGHTCKCKKCESVTAVRWNTFSGAG
jgi:hypothetical protein